MPHITTHVLDTAKGKPAKGVPLTLCRLNGDQRQIIAQAVTNEDGRAADWLDETPLSNGTYCMRFETADYLRRHEHPIFYPWVDVAFEFDARAGHYHIPLLLSPFGYSTYRGS